jgi:hypothetical protein
MNIELQEVLLGILVTAVLAAFKWIAKRVNLNDAKTEAIEAILLAVATVKTSYVDDLKAKSADGVLTDEEKSEARKKAIALVLQIAGPKAAALILDWGEEKVRGYIEAAVSKLK